MSTPPTQGRRITLVAEQYAERAAAVREIHEILRRFPGLEQELFGTAGAPTDTLPPHEASASEEHEGDASEEYEEYERDDSAPRTPNGKPTTRHRMYKFFVKNDNHLSTKKEIAHALGVEPNTVGYVLTAWRKRGVFERVGADNSRDTKWRMTKDAFKKALAYAKPSEVNSKKRSQAE